MDQGTGMSMEGSGAAGLREQATQALRSGDVEQAIEILARVVMLDDNDVDAKALLGVAYSQKGIHPQAIRALTTAVERQPKNPTYRFNLAIVLERAGDMAGCAHALNDTLQLNRDHAQARAKLQALGPHVHTMIAQGRPASAGPPPFPPPPGPAVPGAQTPTVPGYAAPSPAAPTVPGYAAPAPTVPGYAAPTGGIPPMPGSAPMSTSSLEAPPGTVQCPGCMKFSPIGMTCQFCNTALPPPQSKAPATPGMAPALSGGGPGPGYSHSGPGYSSAVQEDDFNVLEGFAGVFKSMFTPKAYFEEQAGYTGFKGPLAYLLALSICVGIANIIFTLTGGAATFSPTPATLPPGYQAGRLVGSLCSFICYWPIFILSGFIWAAFVHLGAKIFGGQSDYGGSFRAGVMSWSGSMLISMLALLIMPFTLDKNAVENLQNLRSSQGAIALPSVEPLRFAQGAMPPPPGFDTNAAQQKRLQEAAMQVLGSMAIVVGLSLIGSLWSLIQLGFAIGAIHDIGVGKGIGAAIVSYILPTVLCCVVGFLFQAAIMAMVAGARPPGN